MCGGVYSIWKTPRQLTRVHGKPLVANTIQLLKECGVEDISISTNLEGFDNFGVEVLHHENDFSISPNAYWLDAFYPTEEPTCYIFGDVVFTKSAIETIVAKSTTDIEFFASAPPFSPLYPKKWAEPFAFKVVDQKHFREAIAATKMYWRMGKIRRQPIAWELWQTIKHTELNKIDYTNFTVINDSTCDIDSLRDAERWQAI